jgi:hypothetical protein
MNGRGVNASRGKAMRKPVLLVCAMLGWAAGARAQDSVGTATLALTPAAMAAAPAAGMSNAAAPAFSSAVPTPAPPRASSVWRFGFRDEKSWQLSMGYAYVRFRSPVYNVNMHGVNTMLAKYFNDWFGLEGEVTAVFGPLSATGQRTKYLFYGGGPRLAARNVWRIEPWMHAVGGGVHFQPQVAGATQSGFGLVSGGGIDWRWKPRLLIRVEGDWMRTRLFGESQNNFQVVSGLVFNF